jgi:hypothetical protein
MQGLEKHWRKGRRRITSDRCYRHERQCMNHCNPETAKRNNLWSLPATLALIQKLSGSEKIFEEATVEFDRSTDPWDAGRSHVELNVGQGMTRLGGFQVLFQNFAKIDLRLSKAASASFAETIRRIFRSGG